MKRAKAKPSLHDAITSRRAPRRSGYASRWERMEQTNPTMLAELCDIRAKFLAGEYGDAWTASSLYRVAREHFGESFDVPYDGFRRFIAAGR